MHAVRRLKLSNYLVGAMDGEALKKLIARDINTFDMESGLTTADYGWGTKNFRQLGLRKTECVPRTPRPSPRPSPRPLPSVVGTPIHGPVAAVCTRSLHQLHRLVTPRAPPRAAPHSSD
jgi:hypothetical protein